MGSALTTHLSPERIKERKAELLRTFERMAEEAAFERVRVFIIAGDLFDTKKITRTTAERVIGIMARYPAVDFLYLSGNHEKSALTECGVRLPENLKMFDGDWTYYQYGDVVIAGRSEITPDMFNTLNLSYDNTNFIVLHGALAQARSGGEIIGIKDIENRHIDYLALGHYHTYAKEELGDGTVAVYSGTPEGRGFDEAGAKGFVLIECDGRHIRHSFRPFAMRTIHIVNVDISGSERRIDVEDRISDSISRLPYSDIVRVTLTGRRRPELFIDADSLAAMWSHSYYHFEVEDSSMIEINPETYRYDKSLKGEFIRLVLSKPELSDAEKDKIIRTGLAALMGSIDEI